MALEGEKSLQEDRPQHGDDPVSIRIEDEYSLFSVRNSVLDRARSIGMNKQDMDELEIMVRELVTNVLTHGGKEGYVVVSHLEEENQQALVLDVVDRGPGFKDFEQAMEDGYTTRGGSLGGGLGSVRRFAQRVELMRTGPDGSHLKVTKRASFPDETSHGWSFALFSRPHIEEDECGDQGTLIRNRDGILLVIADGLGHGANAAEASREVIRVAHSNHRLPLDEMLHVIHKKLHRSRGAAVSLARIRPGSNTLQWLGLGNVSGRFFRYSQGGEIQQQVFANFNGTAGVQMGNFRIMEYSFTPGDWLLIASDGLTSAWVSHLEKQKSMKLNEAGLHLLRHSTRSRDDASILIGRSQA